VVLWRVSPFSAEYCLGKVLTTEVIPAIDTPRLQKGTTMPSVLLSAV
jgi:hypothetical protein